MSEWKFKKQEVTFFFKELGKLLPGHPALAARVRGLELTKAWQGLLRAAHGAWVCRPQMGTAP